VPTPRSLRPSSACAAEIFELHPYVLDHGGLRVALTAHAEAAARRAGARSEVEIDECALTEAQQQLLLSIARDCSSTPPSTRGRARSGCSSVQTRMRWF
jgi:hypothetical protein